MNLTFKYYTIMHRYIALVVSILFICSCEDVVDVSINTFDPALIVEGGIYHHLDGSSDTQFITLKEAAEFLDQSGATPVTNATIMVSDGLETYDFSHTEGGVYISDVPTEIGRSYELQITYNDELITASETLQSIAPIDSIYSRYEEETSFTDAGYFVRIDSRDEPNVQNFYHWKQYVNDTLRIIPDPGNQTNLIASDNFFDGQPFIGYKPNEEIILAIGDRVRVEQLGITEAYFDFLFQIFGQTVEQEIIGSTAPARIIGNLVNETASENFVLGYFTVASVAKAETVVVE